MSIKSLPILFIVFSFLNSSVFHSGSEPDPSAFFENLKTLCGNSYAGEVIQPETPPRGFTDPLTAHFTVCNEDEIRIPFHVGENESRTWILTLGDEGLLFKHDHRYPDGTPEEMTNYGGWAAEGGTEYVQRFPADKETIGLRQSLESHIWKIELSEDMTTYSYSLYLYDDLYFRADFDLTDNVNQD